MDAAAHLAFGLLLLGTSYLTKSIDESYIIALPFHSAAVAFACTGFILIVLCQFIPGFATATAAVQSQRYEAIPLTEDSTPEQQRDTRASVFSRLNPHTFSGRSAILFFSGIIVALLSRVWILVQILRNFECARANSETYIIVLIALYDAWRNPPELSGEEDKHDNNFDDDDERLDEGSVIVLLRRSRIRYILPAFILHLSASKAASIASSPRSSYICPVVSFPAKSIPLLQWLGLILDFSIFIAVAELIGRQRGRRCTKSSQPLSVLGWILLISSNILFIYGLGVYLLHPSSREAMLQFDDHFIPSLIKFTLAFMMIVISSGYLVQRHRFVLHTPAVITTAYILITVISYLWGNYYPFPATPRRSAFLAIVFVPLATILFVCGGFASRSRTGSVPPLPPWLYVVMVVGVLLGVFSIRGHRVAYHPIDMLIFQGRERHTEWRKQASASQSLEEAMETYRVRYGRHPPSGFDKWYKYATERNSVVIDNYDGIYRDLLPFWALSPAEIRERTWQTIANPWNEIAGISIRNGKVKAMSNLPSTHQWMLDGMTLMISQFSEHLPDMDLAVNINNKPRVVVPFESLSRLRTAALGGSLSSISTNSWSRNRATSWKDVDELSNKTVFHDHSFEGSFRQFVASTCPPSTPARTRYHWNDQTLCVKCARPHSLGVFLQNWTLAADICHQPDLASLHGFFTSPFAFKITKQLMPVFSQSKVSGFNDILMPSAWNYMGRVSYAPSDEHPDLEYASPNKSHSLFWRGTTSEGFARGSTWQGMVRQRAVYLLNASMLSSSSEATVLIPSTTYNDKFTYHSLPLEPISSNLPSSVRLVPPISHCDMRSCKIQGSEFSLSPDTLIDFQDHWKYKYLLSLDGTASSGGFLSFLSSRSLPFKAALFREWYDDRLEAWTHFVPLDLRLHGLVATLAYFDGLHVDFGKKRSNLQMDPHEKEGEMIAEAGRAWSAKALRKEDMEIYMFRLLLEWGRMTDDNREVIGYT